MAFLLFDPARWPAREAITRITGVVAVTAMLAWRILQTPRFPGLMSDVPFLRDFFARLPTIASKTWDINAYYARYHYTLTEIRWLWSWRLAIWILETAILAGYVLAWLTRDRATNVARGFMEVVFPLVVAGLPFVIVMTPYTFDEWMHASSPMHMTLLGTITALLLVGELVNVVGLLTLRRSFTIMTEARTLIRGGIYRFIRHPLYAGQFITFLGYTLLHLQPATLGLFIFFVTAQVLRAKIEEQKLAAAFPEYAEYQRTTGMFFPRFRTQPR